jgi:hypothetical protein
MKPSDFIARLRQYYTAGEHENWVNNIQQAISRVSPYLEDDFWSNHFKYLGYQNGSREPDVYNKLHQGLWHLHVANFMTTIGYQLEKPKDKSDIVARFNNQCIFVECVCPGTGNEGNPIRQTYSNMSVGFTEVDNLHSNFVYKIAKHSLEDKVKQIKKRKKDNPGPGIYLLAVNEGLLVNGFRNWNRKDTADRFEQVINEANLTGVDGIIYGSVFEGEYCQPKRGLMW